MTAFLTFAACFLTGGTIAAASVDGRLTISAVDEETHQPLAVRLELRDAHGRLVHVHPDGAVVAGDSIYFEGTAPLALHRGDYTFLIEAGPEFLTRPGNFTIDRDSEDSKEITLKRRVNMQAEGWWGGDLDVESDLANLPLMMRARGLDYVPVATAVNDRGKCRKATTTPRSAGGKKQDKSAGAIEALETGSLAMCGPWASADVRRGGGLLFLGGRQPIDVCRWKADEPSLVAACAGRDAGACVVAITPDAWDLPLWVAAGKVDAVQIIHRPSPGDSGAAGDSGSRPADKMRFPGKLGPGRYSEAIYHHLLECGLRIPPAAGSGAGVPGLGRSADRLLGAGRVYVYCGEQCAPEDWLSGLRAGRVSVTNGPLLRPRVEGQPPGYVFQFAAGVKHQFQIALDLAFYEQTQVEYLEIVKNGQSMYEVRLADLAKLAGRLPPVEFDSTGWFLVRAVTNNTDVYQYATSGPYYVEVGDQPRISRASVQFFGEWLGDAAKKFAGNAAVLADIEAARPFWQKLAARANAD